MKKDNTREFDRHELTYTKILTLFSIEYEGIKLYLGNRCQYRYQKQ